MQEPKIIDQKKQIMQGKSASMSLAKDGTLALWQSFGPHVKEIIHKASKLLYSINVYPKSFVDGDHHLETEFVKWAAVEVNKIEPIEGLQEFLIPAGKYAVFIHKGTALEFPKTLSYIYNEWLPKSKFALDNRPHYEVLKPGYQPNDPMHEEEIWIPLSINKG